MLKWIKYAVYAGVICGVILSLGIVAKHILTTNPEFTVKNVEVAGAKYTNREKLVEVYNPLIGMNIFDDMQGALLISEDPWISKLEIKRVLPDKVIVLITEEELLLTYRKKGRCVSLTGRGTEVDFPCTGVRITKADGVLDYEMKEFVKLYSENPFLRDADIVLGAGLFTVDTGKYKLVSSYAKEVFSKNLQVFLSSVAFRYEQTERIDISVPARIYVKKP